MKVTFISMYKQIIEKRQVCQMSCQIKNDEKLINNYNRFNNEVKIYINEKLFEKNIISEQMYFDAKEVLIKQGIRK